MGSSATRSWVETDRPGELVAVGSPLSGLLVMSVRGSDRCWAEYHSEFKIALVSSRSTTVAASYQSRGEHTAGAGDLMLFEPGDHHVTTRVVGGTARFDVVGIRPDVLEEAARELGMRGNLHFRASMLRSADVSAALEQLVACTDAAAAGRLQLECVHASLLRTVLERCVELPLPLSRRDAVPHAGVRAARNYLREHFREEPSLADLAQCAGLTRFAFAHAFKRYVGLAPHAYLKLRRICEARRLIESGMPITDVARELGYFDTSMLTRRIRARFGVPPARWRQCYQLNAPGEDRSALGR